MKTITFSINKPSNITAALSKVSATIKNSGGSFSGNENSGRFSGSGVEGKYDVTGNYIKITITKKPFFYPESVVENEIRKYFRTA